LETTRRATRRRGSEKIRVVVVDDHPIVRQGLAELISCQDDMIHCGDAADSADALDVIARTSPDVAVVDISLRSSNGIELIKELHSRHPALTVLVLSMHDESFYVERVLKAGARGYVTKDEAAETVISAIRKVLDGQVYVSQQMASKVLSKLASGKADRPSRPEDRLSDRELQVFELLGGGLPTREIAERLNVAIKTVESHRENIKRKLDISNASELVQKAIQWVQSGRGS
jgi:DNA-binding NarL/FixJ family response regulator